MDMAKLVNASNPLVYGAWGEKAFENYFQSIGNDYQRKTTFASDFCIAEWYGVDSIKDTFNRAFEHWKSNIEFLTELAMVVNIWSWFWYDKEGETSEIGALYSKCYYQIYDYACENLSSEDAKYFFNTID